MPNDLAVDHRPDDLPPDMTSISGVDPQEWYAERGYTDGLPIAPPTPETVAAVVTALGGDPDFQEGRVPPRWGVLSRRTLAINIVMAGCRPEYATVVRAALHMPQAAEQLPAAGALLVRHVCRAQQRS